MATWNSIPLEITYETFGWIAFFSWSVSFYPQVILNFRRKSVVGLNFDFVVLNLTKHSSYLIYNASLYFSSDIQHQYFEKYGYGEMIPVAANDVAFSIHAVLLTAITLFQIVIYDRGNQKISKVSIATVCVVWLVAAVCYLIALPSHSWLWLISIFNSIQVFMTVIKYIPQVIMNFMRKSTNGFSIGNILLDFLGGVTSYAQMAVQSVDQNSWVNFYGNIGKTLLSLIICGPSKSVLPFMFHLNSSLLPSALVFMDAFLQVSVFFDLLFMTQHYILYPEKAVPPKLNKEGTEPLIRSSEEPAAPENV